MKLTKYAHACIVLEDQDQKLVIDPGEFTPEFGPTDNIVAVVVTHVHGDHIHPDHLKTIVDANPNVKVFTTAETAEEWKDAHVQVVQAGDSQTVGPFTLKFTGGMHTAVHPDWQQAQNVGVIVNDSFYTPGDSFALPETKIQLLAVPVSAPWLKIGEAMDFINTVKPARFIRTHDGLWNEFGIGTTNNWLKQASEKFGPTYESLNPGESIEV